MAVASPRGLLPSRNGLAYPARRCKWALAISGVRELIITFAATVGLIAILGACRDTSPAALLKPKPESPTFARSPKLVELLPGRVIIRYRAGASVLSVAERHRAKHDADLKLARTAVLDVDPGEEESAASELALDPDVEFAEADYLMTIAPCEVGNCQVTNDPFSSYKWDLHNTGVIQSPDGTMLASTGKIHADIK